jgi:DNA-binding protein H-NS
MALFCDELRIMRPSARSAQVGAERGTNAQGGKARTELVGSVALCSAECRKGPFSGAIAPSFNHSGNRVKPLQARGLTSFAKALCSAYTLPGKVREETHMPAVNLKSMEVDALLKLRSDIDEQLTQRRTHLRKELARLEGVSAKSNGGGHVVGSGLTERRKGKKVKPKYRHPKTGETYAGRGAMAGWLQAELKAGRKLEDFLVEKAPAKKVAKKARKHKAA